MRFPSIQELYAVFKQHAVISTDSRKIIPGSIFFALKGESFDGNRFAEAALKQGAAYSVIDNEEYYKGEHFILVKDSLAALQELAKHHRQQFKIPFLGITGSNGKTTTKELIKAVLSTKYKVLATEGNLNNHIGVPLTLLAITQETQIAIIEMGANHVGEIKALCQIAKPDHGLITNIGKAHIGEFGSFEKIIEAKSELYDHLKATNGKAFVCADNGLLTERSEGMDRVTYGSSEKNYCSCKLVGADPFLKISFGAEAITTKLIGRYNYENATAAICIGKYFEIDIKLMKNSIEKYTPSNNRSQVIKTTYNTLILDAYNANPSSMRVAIENFSEMEGNSKWLIVGDMLELGKYEMEEHKNILELIKDKKFQNVILVGDKFQRSQSEMKSEYMHFKTADELTSFLKTGTRIANGSLVLIKGSRGIKLEKAVEFL